MSIDLERALLQIAGSVHDDDTTSRMTGQVHHMVTRIRRRRAARHTAQGVVGLAAVAAVVVAGVQGLGEGRDVGLPPAATGAPWEDESSTGPVPAPELETCFPLGLDRAVDIGLTIEADPFAPVALGRSLDVELTLTNTGETARDVSTLVPEIVVTLDGRAVGQRASTEESDGMDALEPGQSQRYWMSHDLTTCAGADKLPSGAYEVYALGRRGDDPDPVVVGGPWPFDLYDLSPGEETGEDTAAGSERLLADLLANPSTAPFPACGSPVLLDDGQPPLLLDLELASGPYAMGADVVGSATLRTTEGRHVVATTSAPILVLAKDGVVVGRPGAGAGSGLVTDLTADATSSQEVEGSLHLCTPGVPPVPLPPGTYQAYAVVEGELQEITSADGRAEDARGGLLAANYIPAEVVVE